MHRPQNRWLSGIKLAGLFGFSVTSIGAFVQRWSLQEFCWSTWLTGLVYTWACILVVVVHLILNARHHQRFLEDRIVIFNRIPSTLFVAIFAGMVATGGYFAFRLVTFVFGFYGLFLSFFAEMEPHSLFGRNGFINSDFFTPVVYLMERFWPMVLGTLVSNWRDLLPATARKNVLLPIRNEILRMHVFVLLFPFLTLAAWMISKESWQPVTIIIMSAILFYMPTPATPADKA